MAKEFTKCRFTGRPILKSLTKIIGGKSKSRDMIYEYFPDDYSFYLEPFMGSCTVLIGKEKTCKEVTGDLNGFNVNFYQMVQSKPEALYWAVQDLLRDLDKEKWLNIRDRLNNPQALTEVDLAAAYYIVNKACTNGIVRFNLKGKCNSSYCGQTTGRGWMSKEWLMLVHERLKDTKIIQMDYSTNTAIFDSDKTFTYLDPPYYEVFTAYDKIRFGKEDHGRLFNTLNRMKGKWLLSLNDHPEVRELYKDYNIYPVKINWSCSQTAAGRGMKEELLISNYYCDHSAIQSRLEEAIGKTTRKPKKSNKKLGQDPNKRGANAPEEV